MNGPARRPQTPEREGRPVADHTTGDLHRSLEPGAPRPGGCGQRVDPWVQAPQVAGIDPPGDGLAIDLGDQRLPGDPAVRTDDGAEVVCHRASLTTGSTA